MKKILIRLLQHGLLSSLVLLAVWYVGAKFYTDDFLPGPMATLQGAVEIIQKGVLWQDITVSMGRVLKGWSLGMLVAVPLGLCIGAFRRVSYIIEPLINFFRFVPAIGFITLFLLWFGVGEASKVALIFYATIFPILINTIAGVHSVDPSLIEASQSLGAKRQETFFHVLVPSAVPGIFTGIRLGLSGAIICIVAAEMLAASEGLGYLIYTSRIYYRTDWIFVGIFTLGIIGFTLDRLMQLFGRKALKRYGIR
ncbi:MAG: ABC transporter permease [Lachnospiraceae bacterium]